MFERTWHFRDIPGSMLVRVSVGPSPLFLREEVAVVAVHFAL